MLPAWCQRDEFSCKQVLGGFQKIAARCESWYHPFALVVFFLSNAAAVAVIVNDRKREKLKKKYYKLDALSSVSQNLLSLIGANRELWHDSGTMSCHWPPRTPSESRQPFAPGLNKGWQNVHQPQGFEGAGFRSTELVYATGQDAKIFVS